MAAHITHTLDVGCSEAASRRVSAPHIPLMVVVTDVDGEKPGNSEVLTNLSPNPNSSRPPLENEKNSRRPKKSLFMRQYSRFTKGIFHKNERSDISIKDPKPSSEAGSSSQKVSIGRDVVKPITKWRRICKCFIGLKMTKKTKSSTTTTPSGVSEKPASQEGSMVLRNRSQSLYPGADPNNLSVSPSRSIQSIRSRLSSRSETDFYLFDMGNMSEILTITDIKHIADGYSLHTLYRKMEKIDSPMILAILDTEGRAFGALLSCALRVSEHFYGSCDSFLFRCGPPVEVFKWQPEGNFYFIHSEESFLRVGAGKGNCGLWLDDNLFHGRTEECATFGSPPLVPELDFEVQAVEVWTFGQV